MARQVEKIKGVADLVFCVDATGSMSECLENLKATINNFIEELGKERVISSDQRTIISVKDWRVRLVPFRDRFEDSEETWIKEDFPFVNNVQQFTAQLTDPWFAATGGGDFQESTLDAIYLAAKNSPWRTEKDAHRFIVVFSDAPAREEMHEKTIDGPRTYVEVKNKIAMERIKLVVFGTREGNGILEKLVKEAMKDKPNVLNTSIFYNSYEEAKEAFKGSLIFSSLMTNLAASVSQSSSEER